MQFRAKDYYFIFSLSFMIILVLIFTLKQVRKNNLNDYLDLMHKKLAEMIDDEETRKELDKIYQDFIDQAREGTLNSTQIEKVAENIIELRKDKDKVDKTDLRNILPAKDDRAREYLSSFMKTGQSVDWKKLALQFENSYRKCDSLKSFQFYPVIATELFESQIKLHEKITKIHQVKYQKAREDFYTIKENLSKMDNLPEEIEFELNRVVNDLELENTKLNAKINSIGEIKDQLENERQKLSVMLSHLDTIPAVNFQ